MNGKQLAQAGMDAANDAATALFRTEAAWAVYDIAFSNEEFTTDTVWMLLVARGVDTRERRALGAVMQRAIRYAIIARTGKYEDSSRPEAHSNPKPIYRSLVVNEEPRRHR